MVIVLLVAIILIVSVTLAAIFRESISVTRLFKVTNFSAQSVVWFDGVSDGGMATYKTTFGAVKASVDPNAPNYIGNLRAKVQYKGAGVGLIRVRMIEEWSTTSGDVRTVQPYQIDMPYTIASTYSGSGNKSAWFDNRATDRCLYYATPVSGAGTGAHDISLISGVNTSGLDLGVMPSDTVVTVIAEADVVQVNRYPQYWGLSALPWTGADSSTQTTLS